MRQPTNNDVPTGGVIKAEGQVDHDDEAEVDRVEVEAVGDRQDDRHHHDQRWREIDEQADEQQQEIDREQQQIPVVDHREAPGADLGRRR